MKIFRWKGIIPLVLVILLVAGFWYLYLDTFVERSVESVGAEIVGAKVDLEFADVQLSRGIVVLKGLQVTDPGSPMKNLIEATEIVAAISPGPLLQKKLIIDSLIVHGVRFGTDRKESGALPNPSPTSGLVAKRVSEWASQVRIPAFSLEGIGSQVVNIPAISIDSLRTVMQARAIVSTADSLRRTWEGQVTALDPRPKIDTAQKLVERLKTADVRALGVEGTRALLTSTRSTIDQLTGTISQVKALEQNVNAGVASVKASVAALNDARLADYAYARSLVKLPSLDAPDISPALFGQMGLERLKPLLYWLELAEQYMPAGLDPRRRVGPQRARASGTTVDYPRAESYPRFLLRFADLDLLLGGTNLAAGAYKAQVAGLTTEPSLTGRPMQIVAQRTGGAVGPTNVRVFAQLAHATRPLRDSALATVGGLTLPTVDIPALGARLGLGQGTTEILLSRVGDQVVGRWYVGTSSAKWERVRAPALSAAKGAGGEVRGDAKSQIQAAAEDLLWRTISGVTNVEIEAQMTGTMAKPNFSVRSNIGNVVANSLKKAVGEEVARAERFVRAKVDSLVGEGRREVDERVALLQNQVQAKIAEQRVQLEQAKTDLENRVKELTPKLPGGIQVPGGIRLPG